MSTSVARRPGTCYSEEVIAGSGIIGGLCVSFTQAIGAIADTARGFNTAGYFVTALLMSADGGTVVQRFPIQILQSCNNVGSRLPGRCEFTYVGLPEQNSLDGPLYKMSVQPMKCRDELEPVETISSNAVPVYRFPGTTGNQCVFDFFIPPPPHWNVHGNTVCITFCRQHDLRPGRL